MQCQYKGKEVRKKGETFSVVSDALLKGGKSRETMETFKFCFYMYAECLYIINIWKEEKKLKSFSNIS